MCVRELIKSGALSICVKVFCTLYMRDVISQKHEASQTFVDFSSLFNHDHTNMCIELIRFLLSSPPPSTLFLPLCIILQNCNFYYRRAKYFRDTLRGGCFSLTISRHRVIEVLGETPRCSKIASRPYGAAGEKDEMRN